MEEQVDLRRVFDSMDLGNTGHIRAEDLQKGLSNGTDEPFNIKTCRMMIGMYDRDASKTIDFSEFAQLYEFVDGWVKAFHAADVDGTGEITQPELNKLLNDMGYRLSQKFYTFIGNKFELVGNRGIKFDDFMYVCILLNIVTSMFAKMDYKHENEVDLNYEQFINIVMDVTSI